MENTLVSNSKSKQSDVIAFYSDKQLDLVTSLTRVTRWRMRRKGMFPQPVKLSEGRVGYPKNLIDQWIQERMEGKADA